MATARSRRKVVIDYSKYDEEGTTTGLPVKKMADELQAMNLNVGQTSSFSSNPDINLASMAPSEDTVGDRLLDADGQQLQGTEEEVNDDGLLDYDEVNQYANQTGFDYDPMQTMGHIEEPDPERDIGRDEVWTTQEKLMKENKEKMDRLQKRMQRQVVLAAERLRMEQQKANIQQMQKQIKQMEQNRYATIKSMSQPLKGTRNTNPKIGHHMIPGHVNHVEQYALGLGGAT